MEKGAPKKVDIATLSKKRTEKRKETKLQCCLLQVTEGKILPSGYLSVTFVYVSLRRTLNFAHLLTCATPQFVFL